MIKVKELSFKPILEQISFELPTGKTLAVIGHNGAGKTTLFHLLLGLKFISSGEFTIQEKKRGYVPERPYLEMEETLYSLLKFHLNLISFPKREQGSEISRVSHLIGLEAHLHKKLKLYSKGMLQKALLAQAMLGSPRLIFLDEPMSGLDPDARSEWMKYFQELKRAGVTLVFSSHVMDDVRTLADQVLVLDQGKQKFFGAVGEWKA